MNSFVDSFAECHCEWFKGYDCVAELGKGSFSSVLKFVKTGTKKAVAVKVPNLGQEEVIKREAAVLEQLMKLKMDKSNIVIFYGKVTLQNRACLIFEMLDIGLDRYIRNLDRMMLLEDIRVIIQQMATALDALKMIGMIHSDVKAENIMLVDKTKPLRVKLIDFGLALSTSEAKGRLLGATLSYEAPERLLKLLLSEAIDVWSLGCVLAFMLTQYIPFCGQNDYVMIRSMTKVLGPPPINIIEAGLISRNHFLKTEQDRSIHRLLKELLAEGNNQPSCCYLDMLKKNRLEEDNEAEAKERWECIELLKEMLSWDSMTRITPKGILNHPFITKSFLNSSSLHNSCDTQPLEPHDVDSAVPVAALDAVPVAALDAVPVAALDAVPVAALDAVPVAALDAVPVAALDAVPVAALDAVPVAALDAAPVAALDAVPVAALDAVPVAALDAAPVAALDAVPVAALDEVPVAALDAVPVAALDAVPVAALDAAPVAALDAVPVAALDAAPVAALDEVPVAALDAVPATPGKKMKTKKSCFQRFFLRMMRALMGYKD